MPESFAKPIHIYDAATPLGAVLSRAKALSLDYSENWVMSASFLGRIPDQPVTLSSGKNHYLQGEGIREKGARWVERNKAERKKHWFIRQASFPAVSEDYVVRASRLASPVPTCAHLPPAHLSCIDSLSLNHTAEPGVATSSGRLH